MHVAFVLRWRSFADFIQPPLSLGHKIVTHRWSQTGFTVLCNCDVFCVSVYVCAYIQCIPFMQAVYVPFHTYVLAYRSMCGQCEIFAWGYKLKWTVQNTVPENLKGSAESLIDKHPVTKGSGIQYLTESC